MEKKEQNSRRLRFYDITARVFMNITYQANRNNSRQSVVYINYPYFTSTILKTILKCGDLTELI
jgi:hypothetical protein